jgi:hypothetical protein
MITKKQILQATGEELSKIAGEVLQQKHEPTLYGPYDDPPSSCISCRHCHKIIQDVTDEQRVTFWQEYCKVPLTWPESMKWRDWAVKEFGQDEWFLACMKVMYPESDFSDNKTYRVLLISTLSYMASKADETFYIKAACLCKLNTN